VCPENSLLEWTATEVEGVTIINVYKPPSTKIDKTALPYLAAPVCTLAISIATVLHGSTVLLTHLERYLKIEPQLPA